MRLSLFLLALFAGAVATGTSAGAQNYPWCSNFADGWGGTNCGFTSYEQCMETARGSGGFCTQNNEYKPAAAAAPSRHAARTHHIPKKL